MLKPKCYMQHRPKMVPSAATQFKGGETRYIMPYLQYEKLANPKLYKFHTGDKVIYCLLQVHLNI